MGDEKLIGHHTALPFRERLSRERRCLPIRLAIAIFATILRDGYGVPYLHLPDYLLQQLVQPFGWEISQINSQPLRAQIGIEAR